MLKLVTLVVEGIVISLLTILSVLKGTTVIEAEGSLFPCVELLPHGVKVGVIVGVFEGVNVIVGVPVLVGVKVMVFVAGK